MGKNIRWCILWAGFCDVEIEHLKTRLSSGQQQCGGNWRGSTESAAEAWSSQYRDRGGQDFLVTRTTPRILPTTGI